eukprot:2718923-Pleurochrysis_carterae.AAC.1
MRLERRTAEPAGLSPASRGPPAHRSDLEGRGLLGRSRIRPRQPCASVVEVNALRAATMPHSSHAWRPRCVRRAHRERCFVSR